MSRAMGLALEQRHLETSLREPHGGDGGDCALGPAPWVEMDELGLIFTGRGGDNCELETK